ncbi:hypothetical protein ACA910_006843 [Epithemia clementina (nom. ined.)]
MGANYAKPSNSNDSREEGAHQLIDVPIFVVTFSEGKRGRGVDEFLAALTAIRRAWPHAIVKDHNVLLREVPFKVSVKLHHPGGGANNNTNNNKRKKRHREHQPKEPPRDLWIGTHADLLQKTPERRAQSMAEITAAVSQYRQEFMEAVVRQQLQQQQQEQQ